MIDRTSLVDDELKDLEAIDGIPSNRVMEKLSIFNKSSMIEEQLDDFERRIADGHRERSEIQSTFSVRIRATSKEPRGKVCIVQDNALLH